MATAAYRRSQPRTDDSLKSTRHVFSGLAYLDSTHGVCLGGWPAEIMPLLQRLETRILSKNSYCHIALMPLCVGHRLLFVSYRQIWKAISFFRVWTRQASSGLHQHGFYKRVQFGGV